MIYERLNIEREDGAIQQNDRNVVVHGPNHCIFLLVSLRWGQTLLETMAENCTSLKSFERVWLEFVKNKDIPTLFKDGYVAEKWSVVKAMNTARKASERRGIKRRAIVDIDA